MLGSARLHCCTSFIDVEAVGDIPPSLTPEVLTSHALVLLVLSRQGWLQISEVLLQYSSDSEHNFVLVWSACDLNPNWQVL